MKNFKKKIISVVLSLSLTVLLIPSGVAFAQNASDQNQNNNSNNNDQTVIYFTNDVHGNFSNCTKENGMSYATVKALNSKAQSEGYASFAVDAGDHSSGTAYCKADLGKSMVEFMNEAGYVFAVPGNHEFDNNCSHFFDNLKSWATFEYCACNFYEGNDKEYVTNLLSPYKIVGGNNGLQIALIGVMTPETISATAPGYFQDEQGNWVKYISNATQPNLQNNIYECFNRSVQEAKAKGANVCIGVGHLGDEQSAVSQGVDSTTLINKSKGISAFIDGHSHTIHDETIKDADGNDVVLMQAASGLDANNPDEKTGMNRIGELKLNSNGSIASHQLLKATNGEYTAVTPDTTLHNKEKDWYNYVSNTLSKRVAYSEIDFPYSKDIQRTRSNNLSDLCTDSLYYAGNFYKSTDGTVVGADVAIKNGGGVRAPISKGETTLLTYDNVAPFVNNLCVAEVTGQTILDALEFGARFYPEMNAGLMHISGAQYYIDTTIESTVQVENGVYMGPPTGAYRVNGVQIYNKQTKAYEDLDVAKTYKVAGSDYLLQYYGEGYSMFRNQKVHNYKHPESLISTVLANYAWNFSGSYTPAISSQASTSSTQNADSIPILNSANSVLRKYSEFDNYKINYEDPNGANRIITGRYVPGDNPQPEPTPQPVSSGTSDAVSQSAATSDTSAAVMLVLFIALGGCGLGIQASRRKIIEKRDSLA